MLESFASGSFACKGAIHDRDPIDLFSESETTHEILEFMESKGIDEDERNRCIKRLEAWDRDRSMAPPTVLEQLDPVQPEDLPIPEEDTNYNPPASHLNKRRKMFGLRANEAESPMETRAQLRGSIPDGFDVAGKEGPCLSSTWLMSRSRFAHPGLEMPTRRFYDWACRRCSKKGAGRTPTILTVRTRHRPRILRFKTELLLWK